jgi:hypothetical protein
LSNAQPANYIFGMNLTEARNISSNAVTPLNKSQLGDQTIVMNGTVRLKQATVAAPSSRRIYANASNIEAGRFALRAEAEQVTVVKLTLTDAV